jgi:hypothetical protein
MYEELKCDDESSREHVEEHPTVIMKDPQKMLDDIFEIHEQNDNNDLEINLNRLESLPEKFSDNRFDIDDLMQGDQPSQIEEETEKILKKSMKMPEKKLIYNKKNKDNSKTEKNKKLDDKEDLMLGDEPVLESEKTTQIAIESIKNNDLSTTTSASTTDRQRRATSSLENPIAELNDNETISNDTKELDSTEIPTTISASTTEVPSTTVAEELTSKHMLPGHPIHLSQANFKDPPLLFDQLNTTHTPRKDLGANDDHFIPPMLLVKARFTPTKPHFEETTLEIGSTDTTKETATEISTDTQPTAESSTENSSNSSDIISATESIVETTLKFENITFNIVSTNQSVTEKPILIEKRNDATVVLREQLFSNPEAITVSSSIPDEIRTVNSQSADTTILLTEPSKIATTTVVEDKISDYDTTLNPETISTETSENLAKNTVLPTSTTLLPESIIEVEISTVSPLSAWTKEKMSTISITETTSMMHSSDISEIKPQQKRKDPSLNHDSHDSHEDFNQEYDSDEHSKENKFSNADYEPYKPNRRRVLTKTDHHNNHGSYIKKILG